MSKWCQCLCQLASWKHYITPVCMVMSSCHHDDTTLILWWQHNDIIEITWGVKYKISKVEVYYWSSSHLVSKKVVGTGHTFHQGGPHWDWTSISGLSYRSPLLAICSLAGGLWTCIFWLGRMSPLLTTSSPAGNFWNSIFRSSHRSPLLTTSSPTGNFWTGIFWPSHRNLLKANDSPTGNLLRDVQVVSSQCGINLAVGKGRSHRCLGNRDERGLWNGFVSSLWGQVDTSRDVMHCLRSRHCTGTAQKQESMEETSHFSFSQHSYHS